MCPEPVRALGLDLRDGISKKNVHGCYMLATLTIASFVFQSAAQPTLFRLLLPDDPEAGEKAHGLGGLSGSFILVGEITVIALAGPWGAASDIVGRRVVWCSGLSILGVCLLCHPHAGSIEMLLGLRFVFSIGGAASGAMMTAVLADYVAPKDLGKGSGYLGASSGLGAVLAALGLLRVSSWVKAADPSASDEFAIQCLYYAGAGVSFVGAGLGVLMLNPSAPEPTTVKSIESIGAKVSRGLQLVFGDLVIMLAVLGSFAARGDASTITTFLSLWASEYTRNELGKDAAAGAKAGGMASGIVQLFALFAALPCGWLADRIGGIKALAVAGMMAALSYGGLSLVSNPVGGVGLAIGGVVGVAEMGVVISCQTLITKRAPTAKRGALAGAFSIGAALGILFIGLAGGATYDSFGPGAPFALVAAMNGLLGLFAGFVWYYKSLDPQSESEDPEGVRMVGLDGLADHDT